MFFGDIYIYILMFYFHFIYYHVMGTRLALCVRARQITQMSGNYGMGARKRRVYYLLATTNSGKNRQIALAVIVESEKFGVQGGESLAVEDEWQLNNVGQSPALQRSGSLSSQAPSQSSVNSSARRQFISHKFRVVVCLSKYFRDFFVGALYHPYSGGDRSNMIRKLFMGLIGRADLF